MSLPLLIVALFVGGTSPSSPSIVALGGALVVILLGMAALGAFTRERAQGRLGLAGLLLGLVIWVLPAAGNGQDGLSVRKLAVGVLFFLGPAAVTWLAWPAIKTRLRREDRRD